MNKFKKLSHRATMIIFLLLLSFSIYTTLPPTAQAADSPDNTTIENLIKNAIPNPNATQPFVDEKSLPILGNVIGLNIPKYSVNLEEFSSDQYLDLVPQENVRYILESEDSKLDVRYTYTNGNLRLISVLETQGTPSMTKLATKQEILEGKTVQVMDEQATAKNFLSDYADYSRKSFYNELSAMLDDVKPNQNLTRTTGNTKLEVTNIDKSTTYRWTYSVNGFEAPDKCVALRYKDGFLKYFTDTWELYQIGNTNVNISEKTAINTAIEAAKSAS